MPKSDYALHPKRYTLNIYCDGGSRGNPGPGAYGFVAKDDCDKKIHQQQKFLGTVTNNIAEYQGLIAALTWLKHHLSDSNAPPQKIKVFLDSQLLVNQCKGLFKVKSAHLRQLFIQVKQLEAAISPPIFYYFIPRAQNKSADRLVNQALDQIQSS